MKSLCDWSSSCLSWDVDYCLLLLMVVFVWRALFFLYFLLPLKFLNVRQINTHPLCYWCQLLWSPYVRACLCDRQRCFHTCAGHEHPEFQRQVMRTAVQLYHTLTKAQKLRWENQGEIQNPTHSQRERERERANIHLIWEAPQMLRGFDISADGHWPDLGLIMHSPVAEKKAWVHKLPSEHKQESNRIYL